MTQGQFFKRSLTGSNSEFSFSYTSCLTKAEEPSLPYYLPIAGGRIIGFIPFPKYVKCNQSRIWTRVAVSNSCDDNHYTTGTSTARRLLFVVSKCHFVSVVPWRNILKYLQKCEGCTHFCDTLYIFLSMDAHVWPLIYFLHIIRRQSSDRLSYNTNKSWLFF